MSRRRKRAKQRDGAPDPGTLVVPSHGGGKIRYGSQPSTNAGGPGRPPDQWREAAREEWGKRLPKLLGIADGISTVRYQPAEAFTDADIERLQRLIQIDALFHEDAEWLSDFKRRVERCIVTPAIDDPADKVTRALVTPRDQRGALADLARIGFGAPITTEDVRKRLTQQVALIGSRPTWTADELLAALDVVWS